jgi:RNA polymerase sigma factor (sigma-70 family)
LSVGQSRPQMPSDADLVDAARRGDKEAMAELLRRHWNTAVLLAERVLGSPDLARDAAQEAAIAAMTDLERLRSPDRFGAWFCGIALNVSRRWWRQLQPEVPGLVPDLASASADPAEAAEAADTAARVRGAIAALADGQQDAVRLFYLQGLSHREVAAELDISVGAVKARLHQARAALAPRLVQFTVFTEVRTVTATEEAEWVEVVVSEVRRTAEEDSRQRQHIMVLAERDGDRRLPIWIGSAEATVLALALESVETPRPFPYKLAAGLVEATGSRIIEVKITRLLDSLFYAAVVVQGPDGPREVDARPSDAVNLAVASGAPIWLNSELFSAVLVYGDGKQPVSAPVATAGIAADAQQVMREGAQRRAQRSGPQSDGSGLGTQTQEDRPPPEAPSPVKPGT